MRRLLLLILVPVGFAAQKPAASQDAFLGRWQFDAAKSKLTHPEDASVGGFRIYEADGERTRVLWMKDAQSERLGGYSASCNGEAQPASPGVMIRCWSGPGGSIDGEQIDKRDKTHRYYRREVSADRQTLTITWYSDKHRNRVTDRYVYSRR